MRMRNPFSSDPADEPEGEKAEVVETHTEVEPPAEEEHSAEGSALPDRVDWSQVSSVDAMGKDKRREVMGGVYGPTRTRVFATFAAFFAVVAAVSVGFFLLAKELDKPPAQQADEAPWAQADAAQTPPKPLQ